uniref:Glycerophosphocholine acyltransferase 1 n=1 Tax=Talaromyces marneffei PM1 TaxID=1077442 RepID=A0A093VCQ7_TALMA
MTDSNSLSRSKSAPTLPEEEAMAPLSPDLAAADADGLSSAPADGSISPTSTPGRLSRNPSFSNSSSYQEDWDTFPPLDKLSFSELFDTFSLSQKLEKWNQALNIQRDRVRRQREKLKSVSGLAKDRVVDEWRKRVPTADEQLDKYKVRMRDSVDRLTKQWNKVATVTLREKISFIAGVMNIFISGYLMGAAPERFYWWYTAQLVYFMPIRLYSYHKRGYHYFLADLCYFVNFLSMLSIWVFPKSKRLLIGKIFTSCFWFSFANALASVFIHIMPPAAFHCIVHLTPPEMLKERFPAVWDVKFSQPGAPEHFSLLAMMLWASIPYAIWQLSYHRWITVRRADKIAAGRPTSFTWLRRSYAKTWIGKFVLSLPNILQEPAFMMIQYVYALLTMIPCPLWFWYRWASSIFMLVVFVWSIHNGATYYIDVFGKRFQKELEQLKKDVAKWQASPDYATSPLLAPGLATDPGSRLLNDLATTPGEELDKSSLERLPTLDALSDTTGAQPRAPDAASACETGQPLNLIL